jgi:hypothetical protein
MQMLPLIYQVIGVDMEAALTDATLACLELGHNCHFRKLR